MDMRARHTAGVLGTSRSPRPRSPGFAAASRLARLAAVLTWLLLPTGPAPAAPIMLVTGDDYPPFTGETLPNGGMITELVVLAFREVGHESTIVFRPWKRGYEETRNGVFAATFPYIRTAERLRDFHYSNPINTVHTRIFVTRESPIATPEDLRGRRICIPLGYAVTEGLEALARLADGEDNPVDLVGCLRMMLSGRKDFFVINEANGWATIRRTFRTTEAFRTLDAIVEEETHHLIVPRTRPDAQELVEQFNRGLEKLRRTGLLERVVRRHLRGILE